MPFQLTPSQDCPNCPHGMCISYIREQSKRMRDRNTQYRLSQKASMACTYEDAIPGFGDGKLGNLLIKELAEKCILNGTDAGRYIEQNLPAHFGNNVEEKFSLTSGQIGKVKGDIFETLVRSILWNSSFYLSRDSDEEPPVNNSEGLLGQAKDENYAAINLGDNYDLKRLFHEEAHEKFLAFENSLNEQGTSFCYSTPDVIIVKCRDHDVWKNLANPIGGLSVESQDLMDSAKSKVEGKLDPSDIILAAGIKTSIRSDRMYQLLFEANAWKAIWRSIYKIEPSKYYSLIGQSYGADPNKLNSVEFTSLIQGGSLSKAIDGLIYISTPFALMDWYTKSLPS